MTKEGAVCVRLMVAPVLPSGMLGFLTIVSVQEFGGKVRFSDLSRTGVNHEYHWYGLSKRCLVNHSIFTTDVVLLNFIG